MKLKRFDRTKKETPAGRQSLPTLTVTAKGSFTLSAAVVRMLKLKKGDRMFLHQDTESRTDWFMELTTDPLGFQLGLYKYNQAKFNNTQAATEIFKSIGAKPATMRFSVAERPKVLQGQVLYHLSTKPNPIEEL